MMRDREWVGHTEIGIRAGNGALHLVPREPARLRDLDAVDFDVLGRRLGEEADHEVAGERPRLRAVIPHRAEADVRLLEHLTCNGLFERLARLHEPCKTRESVRHAAWPPREQRA